MKRTVRSDFGEVSIREEGIVFARVLHGVKIGIEEARNYHELVAHLTKNQPHCTVIDLTGISSITAAARKQLQKTSSEWGKTVAVALVTRNSIARFIASFFLTFNRPNYPLRVFTDVSDALSWAQSQYEKHSLEAA